MPANDMDVLRQLNDDYIASVQNSDVKRFQEILSDDFMNTNADGTLVDKVGFLQQIAKPVTISGLGCTDVRIRVMGDAAIIHAKTTYTKPDQQPGAGRYTDIWQRRSGKWLCVAAQVTRG